MPLEALPLANLFVYFANSNLAGKIIVLLLLVASLLAWTVMIGKYFDLKRMRHLNHHFARILLRSETVLSLDVATRRRARGPYAEMLRDALESYARAGSDADHRTRMGHVVNALQRSVADHVIAYESRMVLLSSIVTGAPFMGLLGTVWGVMVAFGAIGDGATASVGDLAPGVSGALLTTVAALVVAIPSVFGYNFLLSQTKLMITELENFASELADRIELESREQD